jgi:hypothetical protein
VFGLCTILSKKREGATFVVHVECKGPGGSQMLSDVNLTPREDKTIDFSDQDQTYKAVLVGRSARRRVALFCVLDFKFPRKR